MTSPVLGTLLPLVRCPHDGGALAVLAAYRNGAHARIQCASCATTFLYEDHILDLMEDSLPVERESVYELYVRDREATSGGGRQTELADVAHPASIAALGDLRGKTVLELGSGRGVFTHALWRAGAHVIGVDFSREALRINAPQLPADAPVLLVRCDVGRVRLASRAFDAGVSSLYSNLPTQALRDRANAAVAEALRPGARYWVDAHHRNSRRLLPVAADAPVGSNGILFQNFTSRTLTTELSRHFAQVRVSGGVTADHRLLAEASN